MSARSRQAESPPPLAARRLPWVAGGVLLVAAVATNLPGVDALGWPRSLFQAVLWATLLGALWVRRKAAAQPQAEPGGGAGASPGRWSALDVTLGVVAVFALASHVHFGRFHGEGRFQHHHELFHHTLATKYYDELGHLGFYHATSRALVENDPDLAERFSVVKNLRTYQLESAAINSQRAETTLARFSDARWADFKRDVAFYQTVIPPEGWAFLLVDHGYNATPFWTAVASQVSRRLEVGHGMLALATALDPLLLALMLAVVWRTFGRRTALLFATFVFANMFASFDFTGGGILRQLWLVATVGAVCAYHRGRLALAGVLLGIAALDRAFPLVFALAPLAHALWETRERRTFWHGPTRMLLSMGATLVVLGGGSALLVTGLDGWQRWYENISAHDHAFFINQISLRNLFVVDPTTALEIIDAGWDESRWLREREALQALRGDTLSVVRGLALALLGLALLRRRPLPAVFALVAFVPLVIFYPANYYSVFLCLAVLGWSGQAGVARGLALGVLALQLPLWLLRIALPPPLHLELLHWYASLGLMAVFAGALVHALRESLAEQPAMRKVVGATLGVGVLLVGWTVVRTPAVPAEVVVDLCVQDVRSAHKATVASQQMPTWGNAWSLNDQLSCLADGPGARVIVEVPIPAPTPMPAPVSIPGQLALPGAAGGRYRMLLDVSTAPSFGIVRPEWVGGPRLEPVDLYSPGLGVRRVVTEPFELPEGLAQLAFVVEGKHPAASHHHFAVDRVLLEPVVGDGPSTAVVARGRAFRWMARNPADAFDGGRRAVAAEVVTLALLLDDPTAEIMGDMLIDMIEARLALLSTGFARVLPGECEALLQAAVTARRLGLAPPGWEPFVAEVVRVARAVDAGRTGLRTLTLCAALQRLDPSGGPACDVEQSFAGREAATRALSRLIAGPVDRRRAPEVSAALRTIAEDVVALTGSGHEPLPADELFAARGLWPPLCANGLRWAADTGDLELTASLVEVSLLLGIEDVVTGYGEGVERLVAAQDHEGSLGSTRTQAPDSRRDAVLAVLRALAAEGRR